MIIKRTWSTPSPFPKLISFFSTLFSQLFLLVLPQIDISDYNKFVYFPTKFSLVPCQQRDHHTKHMLQSCQRHLMAHLQKNPYYCCRLYPIGPSVFPLLLRLRRSCLVIIIFVNHLNAFLYNDNTDSPTSTHPYCQSPETTLRICHSLCQVYHLIESFPHGFLRNPLQLYT